MERNSVEQRNVSAYKWFSRYAIAAMLVHENKRFLISSFCSSTSNCTLQHCYLCPCGCKPLIRLHGTGRNSFDRWKIYSVEVLWSHREHANYPKIHNCSLENFKVKIGDQFLGCAVSNLNGALQTLFPTKFTCGKRGDLEWPHDNWDEGREKESGVLDHLT